MFHGWKYCEHRNFGTDEDEPLLFASTHHGDDDDDGNAKKNTLETLAEGDESMEEALAEPLLDDPSSRRDFMKKDSLDAAGQTYFYQTAYFDRIKVKQPSVSSSISSGDDDGTDAKVTPRQVYKSVADSEDSEAGVNCYHRVWRFLPLTAIFGLFIFGTLDTFRCCICSSKRRELKSEFQELSCGKKTWFVFRKILKLLINFACVFVVIVACGDSHQSGAIRATMPYVEEKYSTLNVGPVCAYDKPCGDLKTLVNKEAADAANYHVAHCGKCSGCSTWQDLSVQWTTRKQAALLSRNCLTSNFFSESGQHKCLQRDLGWTSKCADAWVHTQMCARNFCKFIALRQMITNSLGNFQMAKDTVTAATCNEAFCEQGNPGRFAELSGASRRKMNIKSSIEREPDQQCQIVDPSIPRDAEGRYNNWGPLFEGIGLKRLESGAMELQCPK